MKPLVAIFAHPDDEAFGPAGKIALEAKKRDVYLICVTDGAMGINSTKSEKDLVEIRKSELRDSAKILGVKKVTFLGYKDGSLNNNLYLELAGKIEDVLLEIKPDTLLTFELHGLSGHLDHVAVSLISTFIYNRLDFINELLYYCMDERESAQFKNNYFIYFPEGYCKEDVNLAVDVSSVWNQKIDSINAHKSQKHDAVKMLEFMKGLPKEEFFLVNKKNR